MKKYLIILPFLASSMVFANTVNTASDASVFQFSTEVSREVEKDLMQATVFVRKQGKSLPELKKQVSIQINQVIEQAQKQNDIELNANGIRNYVNYGEKGKINGWVAESYLTLKGKNFESIAIVLENLPAEVAVSDIYFSVSKEQMVALEDEMTLDIIKQFQHKAELIQKSLNAKRYTLSNIHLETPNGNRHSSPRMMMAMSKSANLDTVESMPLEAGKETISARASGSVKFE